MAEAAEAGIQDARVRLARLLIQAGRPAEAEARLRRDVAAAPGNVELRWELASALLCLGKTREYISLLRDVLAARPDWPGARLNLARTLIHQGDLAEADAVLGSGSRGASAWEELFLRARLLNQMGRLEEAARAFRLARDADPARYETYFAWCETLQRLDRTRQMLAMLRRARKSLPPPGPRDLAGWIARFRLALCACDAEEAVAAAEKALALNPSLERLEELRWPVFIDEFDLTYAAPEFQRAALRAWGRLARARPRLPWGYYYRAILTRSLSRGQEAPEDALASDLATAARLAGPRRAWMRMELAKNHLFRRDFHLAAAEFGALLRAYPEHWMARCLRAEALLCQGDRDGAERAFEEAERAASDFARANVLAWRGAALLWSGDYAGALRRLEEASRGPAQYAHCWRGGALVMLGRREEALSVLDKAASVSPWDLEARIWRGEALYGLGRLDEALAALDDCLARGRNWYAHVLRGLVHAARGDADGLRRDFRALPGHYREVERALRSLGLSAADTEERRRDVLRRLLELSRGVRRADHTTSVWLSLEPE